MNRRGFTLLEVLVATTIMGIAVAGLIAGLSQSVNNASRLTDYDRAAMLARTKMSDLLLDSAVPFDGMLTGNFPLDQSGGVPAGWQASFHPYEAPPKAGPGTMIVQRVTLSVWWQPPSGSRRKIDIETYRGTAIPQPAGP